MRRQRSLWGELPSFLWMVLLWVILWRDVSGGTVVMGVVVAALVLKIFYLPPLHMPGRFHVGWAVAYVGVFLGQLVVASVQVSVFAVTSGPRTPSAVISVPLRSDTDVMLAATSQVMSLIPGSVIIKVDRQTPQIFVHALGVAHEGDARVLRARIRATEAWLIRVMGSGVERDQLAQEGR